MSLGAKFVLQLTVVLTITSRAAHDTFLQVFFASMSPHSDRAVLVSLVPGPLPPGPGDEASF